MLLRSISSSNYVVQHLVGQNLPRVTDTLLDRLQGNFVTLSCNKYASNVVEKIIVESREDQSTRVITELLRSSCASMLLVDAFGNFVIQKALNVAKVSFSSRNSLVYDPAYRIRNKMSNACAVKQFSSVMSYLYSILQKII